MSRPTPVPRMVAANVDAPDVPIVPFFRALGAVEACGADQRAFDKRAQDEVGRRVRAQPRRRIGHAAGAVFLGGCANSSGSVSRASRRRYQKAAGGGEEDPEGEEAGAGVQTGASTGAGGAYAEAHRRAAQRSGSIAAVRTDRSP